MELILDSSNKVLCINLSAVGSVDFSAGYIDNNPINSAFKVHPISGNIIEDGTTPILSGPSKGARKITYLSAFNNGIDEITVTIQLKYDNRIINVTNANLENNETLRIDGSSISVLDRNGHPKVNNLINQDVNWGDILGDITNQPDLINYLNDNFLQIGATPNDIELTCGENVSSHMPVCLVGDRAMKGDCLNVAHSETFVGFSIVSGVSGEAITVRAEGVVTLHAWGLSAGSVYLIGPNGSLSLISDYTYTFKNRVGLALSSDSLLILHNQAIKTS